LLPVFNNKKKQTLHVYSVWRRNDFKAQSEDHLATLFPRL